MRYYILEKPHTGRVLMGVDPLFSGLNAEQKRRILVVNPPNSPPSSRGILIEPIDALTLASVLQSAGHDTLLVDMDVRRLTSSDVRDIARRHAAEAAVVVLDYHIPLHGDAALSNAVDLAEALAEADVRTILGGKAATFEPELSLRLPAGSLLARGELEGVVPDLLALPEWSDAHLSEIPGLTFLKDGQPHQTPARTKALDLDRLPIPDRGLVDLTDYVDVRTMLTSRGCNLTCAFCHVPGFWGKWRARSPEVIVEEIRVLHERFGARKILFLDDNAIAGRRRMLEICKHLARLKLDVALGCLGTVVSFDETLAAAMAEAGFRWIHFGAESGDDQQLADIQKRATRESILTAVRTAKEAGLRVRTSWILDLPGSTPESLARTVDTILAAESDEIRLHHLAIRLGSAYHAAYGELPSTQYIHQGRPMTGLPGIDLDQVMAARDTLLTVLEQRGYAVVRHADEFIDVDALKQRSPDLRVVSLCPLRYGLGW